MINDNSKYPPKGETYTTGGNMTKKWTEEELEEHIKLNCKDYSATVVIAMFYRKLYGKYPKIGMSGAQRDFAESVKDKMPEPNPNAKYL